MTTQAFDFEKASKAECIAESERLLDKAVQWEAESKNPNFVDKLVDKAVAAESLGHDGRA